MRWLIIAVALLCSSCSTPDQQINDPEFSARVERPAFRGAHPRVGLDEAHRNFHTRGGRYKPFVDLMEADGYLVVAAPAFDVASLSILDILVIANAQGPAFTPQECDSVRDWVRAGGALLLIADHAPFGDTAAELALRFGVEMGRGHVSDANHSTSNPTWLVFTTGNGLLGDHAIVRGRDAGEAVRRVVAFTGQSLTVPAGATPLLKLSSDATETTVGKLEGRAQGIAIPFGKGRVAVFGEAAMFSAQVATINGRGIKAGMNVPGNDNRQFALNVVHWLSGLIN